MTCFFRFNLTTQLWVALFWWWFNRFTVTKLITAGRRRFNRFTVTKLIATRRWRFNRFTVAKFITTRRRRFNRFTVAKLITTRRWWRWRCIAAIRWAVKGFAVSGVIAECHREHHTAIWCAASALWFTVAAGIAINR